MDTEPHVHQPKIGRHFGQAGGAWEITYGDTRVWVGQGLRSILSGGSTGDPPPPTSKQIHRALVKAIRKHDKGSRAERLPVLPVIPAKAGQWPSDYLKDVKLG